MSPLPEDFESHVDRARALRGAARVSFLRGLGRRDPALREAVERALGEGGDGKSSSAEDPAPAPADAPGTGVGSFELVLDESAPGAPGEPEPAAAAPSSVPGRGTVPDDAVPDDAVPIDAYCDRKRMPLGERLRLLENVCDTVLLAHRDGHIHGAIDTPRVLVTERGGRPVPIVTGAGERPDPADADGFIAPEQLRGGRTDARTDVYGLGAVLYRLVIGNPPHDFARLRGMPAEELRLALEEKPRTPGDRFDRLEERQRIARAEQRGLTPRALVAELEEELDRIAVRAVQPDPERRYPTVVELRQDLERYRRHLPVEAGSTAGYRMRMFARRHARALGAAGAVAAALVAGIAVTSWLAVRAAQAERDARDELARAHAVHEFVTNDLLATSNPLLPGDRVRLADVLRDASASLPARFPDAPATRAEIHTVLGRSWLGLGEFAAADSQFTRAEELLAESAGEERLATRRGKARALLGLGDAAAAVGLAREVHAAQVDRLGALHPEALRTQLVLAEAMAAAGAGSEARTLLAEAVTGLREALGPGDPEVHRAARHQALAMVDPARRAARLSELVADAETGLGERHPVTVTLRADLGSALLEADDDRAGDTLRRALDDAREVLGPLHPATLGAQRGLARAAADAGRSGESVRLLRGAVDATAEALGEEHPLRLELLADLSERLAASGREAEADSLYLAVEELTADLPSCHELRWRPPTEHAEALRRLGRCRDALTIARVGTERREACHGATDDRTIDAVLEEARALNCLGRRTSTDQVLRDLSAKLESTGVPDAAALRPALLLSEFYREWRWWTRAEKLLTDFEARLGERVPDAETEALIAAERDRIATRSEQPALLRR